MFNTRQTILASRPAAMVLALTLVAALSTPFVLLSRAQADPTPLPCNEANHNGCTELSSTPPEDTVSVPPNIVLMLDDSGSMAWDFMPDWEYLADASNNGVRDSNINGVYYNPNTVYTPPPQADSTSTTPDLYPDSPGLTNAYNDGFTDTAHKKNLTSYTGGDPDVATFAYYTSWTIGDDVGPATPNTVTQCPSGYKASGDVCTKAPTDPVTTSTWTCAKGDKGPTSHDGNAHMCRHGSGEDAHWYEATKTTTTSCPSGSTAESDGKCHWKDQDPVTTTTWTCPNPPGGSPNGKHRCIKSSTVRAFTYVTGNPYDPDPDKRTPYVQNYVAAGDDCSKIPASNCVDEGDTSGAAAPSTYKSADGTTKYYLAQDGTRLTAGQNVANWFSYYRTRLLMAKSGLMTAFSQLGPKYRFGFASINGNGKDNIPSTPTPYGFDDAGGGGGDSYNRLAVVQPFGDGSAGTQKALFWKWIANESAASGTPLRKALQAAGQYYQSPQPWQTMSSDPGWPGSSSTQFACRASYTILTTDGFWNGGDPTTPDGIVGAANNDGTAQSVPSGDFTQYKNVDPFQGGGAVGDGGTSVASLADVATYYWENDLQPGADMPNELAPSSKDPAAWQHMTTYTVGLGFSPLYADKKTPIPMDDVFTWAHNVDTGKPTDPTPPDFSWPTPSSNSLNNIADLAHAAVNGHGNFFSAKDPTTFAAEFGAILTDIGSRTVAPSSAAVNASVLSQGALSFSTGYSTDDWSGAFEAVTLKPDGTVDQVLWMSGSDPTNHLPSGTIPSVLDTAYHNADSSTGYGSRNVFTDSYKIGADGTATFSAFQFDATNKASLDGIEISGLGGDAACPTGSTDTLCNRIDYLLGDNAYEGTADGKLYRARSTILGAILRAAPVYVAGATGNYYNGWPNNPDGTVAAEAASGAQTYDAFVSWASSRKGTVYVGANDGMLHAFNAPVPTCSSFDASTGECSASWVAGSDAGKEDWAFIPRAVYANLGNLTVKDNFQFRRTVDATPVTRDVFFSDGAGKDKWHSILVGGVGLGGRGVYALDITDPTVPDFGEHPMTKYPASGVLWEFDSDMAVDSGCKANYGACNASDLGFTVSQPNVGRLSTGGWVVLVPNGYFPDCDAEDIPTADKPSCQAIAAQAPKNTSDGSNKPYSALFVLDAQTGKMLAELKTPTGISGVTSFGLATPVLGDYQNDQVDDVAFAGDVQGNLWRFDLHATDASGWTVTLVYKGLSDASGNQGVQPITTMPHLFPDPTTNRFMVTFGTGKYLGMGDNNSGAPEQGIYGVRDQGSDATLAMAYSQGDLAPRYLHETSETMPDGSTATLRCITAAADDACDTTSSAASVGAAGTGGWYVNLRTTTSDGTTNDDGERVVVNPGAIFSSNTVVFETLITGAQSTDPCDPATQGSILALNAITGGSAGASSLGGGNIAGGRINNARTSGSLPLVSSLGGGQAYLPGMTLAPGKTPISIDAPIWRRRSWNEINQDQ